MLGKTEYTKEEKLAFVEEFRNSGLSQNKFSKLKGIPPTTFGGWLRLEKVITFGEIDLKKTFENKSEITKAKALPVQNVKKSIIFAKDDIKIELKEGYDKELLKRIVEVLINVN